jgi:hypothetical protein
MLCSLAIKRFNLSRAKENLNQQKPIVDCVIVFDQLFPSPQLRMHRRVLASVYVYNNLHLPPRHKPNYMQANLNVIRRVFSAGQQ